MAKKKNAPPPRDDDDDDDLIPEVTPAPRAPEGGDDAQTEIAAVLAELGGSTDASLSVTKVGMDGREERLSKFMPREFDVDSLRDRWGGGVYWIYVHVGGRIHTKRRVVFARTLDEQRGGDGKTGASSAAGDSTMAAALERMAQQNREMLQMMVQLITANRAPATDPMMIITAAEKLANLGNRGNGGDELERSMRLLKFAREFGGGGEGGGEGIAGVAMEVIRAIREASSHPAPPQLAAPGAPSSVQGDPQQMMILIRRALAERLPLLIRGAQAESDPAVYAQLVLDQLPGLYLEPLLRELQKPEWFNLLVQVDGRVVPHQPWFEALRNEILQATSQPEPPAS